MRTSVMVPVLFSGGLTLSNFILSTSPTAWLRNQITSGTSIPDASGNSHTGTLSGNTAVDRAGVLGFGSDLESELLTNGDMSSATGWTITETNPNSDATFSGGQCTITTDGTAVSIQQNVLTEGQSTYVVIDVESITGAGSLLFKSGVGTDSHTLSAGTNIIKTVADGAQFLIFNSGVVTAVINSCSAKHYSGADGIYFDDGTTDGLIQMAAGFATASFEKVVLCWPTSYGESNAGAFFSYTSGDSSGYPIARWNAGNTITFRVFNSAVTQFEARTSTTFALHRPHLLFFECRGVGSALRVFRGTAAGAVEVSYAVQQTPTGTMRDSTGQTLNWGNRANTTTTFKGILDECITYNGTTLTSSQRDTLSKLVSAVYPLA